MLNEDFPALPGTQNRTEGASPLGGLSDDKLAQDGAQTTNDGQGGQSGSTAQSVGSTTDKAGSKQGGECQNKSISLKKNNTFNYLNYQSCYTRACLFCSNIMFNFSVSNKVCFFQ